MKVPRGRILRATHDENGGPGGTVFVVPECLGALPRGRVLKRAQLEAMAETKTLLADAEARARAIVADAERAADEIRRDAYEKAREQSAAELAAEWMRLRAEQASRDEKDLERTIELARMMAERLLIESLSIEPQRIRTIARQALTMLRHAHSIEISAHPDDATVLQAEIGGLGLEASVLRIHADVDRPRGSLMLRTDLGTLDADLSLQLDRLAAALRVSFSR